MKLAVLGDFIIDEYLYYKSTKLSPEAPCPVARFIRSNRVAGGAANVANSCFSLGIDICFIFCAPLDQAKYTNLLDNYPIFYYTRKDFFFSTKKRHYIDNKQFFREDREMLSTDFEDNNQNIENLIKYLINKKIDFLIISDYQKGALTPNEMEYLLNKCKKFKIKTFVDTKIKSKKYLKNIFLIKPNLQEFQKLIKYKARSNSHDEIISELEPYANNFMSDNHIENCIITLSELGSVWYKLNQKTVSYLPPSISVKDIVGAGDSFLSGLVYSFINDKNYTKLQKLKISNNCSEITIKQEGTNPISGNFLKEILKDLEIAEIGFTNGCFDILHPGHISLLKQAKQKCKFLIVGLNSDLSVKRLKGNNRPINSQEDRKKVLENIKWVDQVIIFDEDTPLNLIKKINPNLLIKGSDYKIEEVVGAEFVKENGGQIFLANLLETASTTERFDNIIE